MDLSQWFDPQMKDSSNQYALIKPFNMRYVSLENFPSNDRRSLNRVAAINRFKEDYLINCPFKSISLLQRMLQTKINNEIQEILQKYTKTFLEPVIANVRENLRNNELADELNINAIMHQVLDEAKKLFPVEQNNSMLQKLKEDYCKNGDEMIKERQDQNYHQQASTNSRPRCRPKNRNVIKSKAKRKRKGLVTCSENANTVINKNVAKNKLYHTSNSNDDKWDPSRLSTKTLFVLGSKANKALGFGAARGRLYSKHSDLFRYIGDHEDKEWLHKNQLMPATGGKAYLLVKDDIVELMNSNEYRNTPGVNMDDMGAGFTVPQSMIKKITTTMKNMKRHNSKQSPSKLDSTSRIKAQVTDDIIEESTTNNQMTVSTEINSVSDLSAFITDAELLSQFNNKDFTLDQ